MKTFEQAKNIQDLFATKYNILTVARKGITKGAAVRVTPALYNTTGELDRLVDAIQKEHAVLLS